MHGTVAAQAGPKAPREKVPVINGLGHDEIFELAVSGFDLPDDFLGHRHGSIALDVSHAPASQGGIVRHVDDTRFERKRDTTPVQVADHGVDLLLSGLQKEAGVERENVDV
jgi:hypothetical protein